MGQRIGLVEREKTMTKRRSRRAKRGEDHTHVERGAKTLGDAAPPPRPEPRIPPPVQVVQRVRCPYCKTAAVTWDGTRTVQMDGGEGRVRYYVCRECCDPSQGDMSPTRFKVLETGSGE